MERSRQTYDEALAALHEQLLVMSSRVERMIEESVSSLAKLDGALAERVVAADDEIDAFEFAIEEGCVRIIALQQPIARDLRMVISALKVIHDLERMADHSVDIAEVTIHILPDGLIKPLVDIPRMAAIVQEMVHEALDAFVKNDVELARKVCDRDDTVDALYAQLYEELCELAATTREKAKQALHLLMVARHLERIADHATNIAERAIYLKTGRVEKAISKRDTGKWGA